jgi:hypothetical protein
VVSFVPRPLYPQKKSPLYPLDRRLGRPQSRSRRGGEENNSQPPPPESNPRTPIVQTLHQMQLTVVDKFFSIWCKCSRCNAQNCSYMFICHPYSLYVICSASRMFVHSCMWTQKLVNVLFKKSLKLLHLEYTTMKIIRHSS